MPGNLERRLCANRFWGAATSAIRGVRTTRLPSSHSIVDSNHTVQQSLSRGRAFLRRYSTRTMSSIPSAKKLQVGQRFTSTGFFILGASQRSSAVEAGATCAASAERSICNTYDKNIPHSLAPWAWKRSFHTSHMERAENSSQDRDDMPSRTGEMPSRGPMGDRPQSSKPKGEDIPPEKPIPNRHLMHRLPHMPHLHRPSKEELLAAANGFWSRLKVRFKWFSIRSVRPFNFDEIAALFSWVLLGHVVWVVVGTTTFFSLVIFAINTVLAQGERNAAAPVIVIAHTLTYYRNAGWMDW